MKVYLAPDGLWHVQVNSYELRQHYFTKESAIAAGSVCMSSHGIEALTNRGTAASPR
jgi:hypothetical protein